MTLDMFEHALRHPAGHLMHHLPQLVEFISLALAGFDAQAENAVRGLRVAAMTFAPANRSSQTCVVADMHSLAI